MRSIIAAMLLVATKDRVMTRFGLIYVYRKLFSVLLIVANGAVCRKQPPGDCPHDYWDEQSKRCSDNLLQFLDGRPSDERISGEAAELRLNQTCRGWDRTNDCYQKLIQRCHDDTNALHELRLHIGRYAFYSKLCQDPDRRDHKKDCFLPDAKSTRRCTDAIERYLNKFVESKEYRSACRVINTAMKCFHDIKNNIRQRCQLDWAEVYEQRHIVPLVDRTRDTVLTQCSFTSPYKDYYMNRSPTKYPSPSLVLVSIATTATTLLLARALWDDVRFIVRPLIL